MMSMEPGKRATPFWRRSRLLLWLRADLHTSLIANMLVWGRPLARAAKGDMMIGILLWFVIFSGAVWALLYFLRRNDRPIVQPWRSHFEKIGLRSIRCHDCGGNGATHLNGKILSAIQSYRCANQIQCMCCTGLGFHWVRKDTDMRCYRGSGRVQKDAA